MLALVVGIVQLWPALVSNRVLQNPILQVSDLKVTTKKGATATDFDAGKERSSPPGCLAAVWAEAP